MLLRLKCEQRMSIFAAWIAGEGLTTVAIPSLRKILEKNLVNAKIKVYFYGKIKLNHNETVNSLPIQSR